jgi:hypothetical protein
MFTALVDILATDLNIKTEQNQITDGNTLSRPTRTKTYSVQVKGKAIPVTGRGGP